MEGLVLDVIHVVYSKVQYALLSSGRMLGKECVSEFDQI